MDLSRYDGELVNLWPLPGPSRYTPDRNFPVQKKINVDKTDRLPINTKAWTDLSEDFLHESRLREDASATTARSHLFLLY